MGFRMALIGHLTPGFLNELFDDECLETATPYCAQSCSVRKPCHLEGGRVLVLVFLRILPNRLAYRRLEDALIGNQGMRAICRDDDSS